jgi:ABC-2 type transport system permease protein
MVSLKQFSGIGKFMHNSQQAYRFDYYIWMILIPMFFIVEYFLWKYLFLASGQAIINGFTFSSIATYYLMSHIVGIVTNTNIDRKISFLVKKGLLIRYIIKPIHYYVFTSLMNMWRAIFKIIRFTPPLLFVAYLLIPKITYSHTNFSLFIISVLVAHVIKFAYIFVFAMTSFWLKEYMGVRIIRKGIEGFFTGYLIPLNFFPLAMQNIFNYLPFQYMLYVPINIYLGTYSIAQSVSMIGVQVVWALIFVVFALVIWKRAFKKFMGVGV